MVSSQVTQLQQALQSEIDDVAANVGDWAPWDDTYYFVVGDDPEYIENNLMVETFENLRMNLMVFINETNDIYYAKSVDYQTGEITNISQDVIDYISSHDPLFEYDSLESILKGIILLPEGPLLFSTMQIITSGYEGPSHGSLFMGRYIDTNEINYIQKLTNLNATIYPKGIGGSNEGGVDESYLDLFQGSIVTKELSEDIIAGYSIIREYGGTSELVLEVNSFRAIYQQGKETILSIQIIVGILGLIFGSVFLIILYGSVIVRITSLNNQVTEIGKNNAFSKRVIVTGTDEVSMLAHGINDALHELEINRVNLANLNKTLEIRVQHRTAEVKALLKHKDDFINQLGHDLKNPLGPLINLLPVVKKHITENKDQEIVDTLIRNVNYMKNLVVKTIELAQLSSPNTKLRLEEIHLESLIRSVIEDNEYHLKEKNIHVETDIPKDLLITGDRLRLQELFVNLLNNSIKFSPNDGIIRIKTKNDFLQATISIHDQGIGMNEYQLSHIFDEFYKADESRHDFDSSGLGMPISKRIVEKHGGCIWAESNGMGKGSSFYFTLPLHPSRANDQFSDPSCEFEDQSDHITNNDGRGHEEIIQKIDRLFTVE